MSTPDHNSQELTQSVLNHAVFHLHSYKADVFQFHYWEVYHALYPWGTEPLEAEEGYAQKQRQIDRLVAHELNGTWWFVSSLYCWWYDIRLIDTQRYMLGILDQIYNRKLRVEHLLPGERSFIALMQSNSLAPLFVLMGSVFIGLKVLQSFSMLIRRTWAAFGSTKVSSQKSEATQVGSTMKSRSAIQTSAKPSTQADWHEYASMTTADAVEKADDQVNRCSAEFNKIDWSDIVVVVKDKAYPAEKAYLSCEQQIRSLFKQMRSPTSLDDVASVRQIWKKINEDIAYITANLYAKEASDVMLAQFSVGQVKQYFKDLLSAAGTAWSVSMPFLDALEKSVRIASLKAQVNKLPALPESKNAQNIKKYFDIENAKSLATFWQERYCSHKTTLDELAKIDLYDVYVEDFSGREVLEEVGDIISNKKKAAEEISMAYLQIMFEEAKEKVKSTVKNIEMTENIDVDILKANIEQSIEKFAVEVVCFGEAVCPGVSIQKAEFIKHLKNLSQTLIIRLHVLALLSPSERQSQVAEYKEMDEEQEKNGQDKEKTVSVFEALHADIDSIQQGLSRFDDQLLLMDKMTLIFNYAVRLFHLSSDKRTLLDPAKSRGEKRLFVWLQESAQGEEKLEWEKLDKKVLKTFSDLNTAFAQCLEKMRGGVNEASTHLRQSLQEWNNTIGTEEVDGDLIFLRKFFSENDHKLQSLKEKASNRSTQSPGQEETTLWQMSAWFSQMLSPVTLSQRWQEIGREQETSQKAFLELLEAEASGEMKKTVTHYVLQFEVKLGEYEEAFDKRYKECGDIGNATAMYLIAFKNQYLEYKKEIAQARHYLKALEVPAAGMDGLGYETTSSEIRGRAHALFLKAAPDRNQNKGVFVEKMSTVLMQLMLKRKDKLLTSNRENDIFEAHPFYDRYDVIYDEVGRLEKQAFAMRDALKDSVLLGTEIVPVYDEKKIDDLDREFETHIYQKVKEKKISRTDAHTLTGLFSLFCFSLKDVARLSIKAMGDIVAIAKLNERTRVAEEATVAAEARIAQAEARIAQAEARIAQAEARAAEEKARAAEEKARATAILPRYGLALLEGFKQDIADGKLSADHPIYLQLMNVHHENSYLKQEDSFLGDCFDILKDSGGTGLSKVLSMTEGMSSTSGQSRSEQTGQPPASTGNGLFLSEGSSTSKPSSKVGSSKLVG